MFLVLLYINKTFPKKRKCLIFWEIKTYDDDVFWNTIHK